MVLLEHYLSLATKSIFIENILLSYFLGMCSFLAVSKKIDSSIGIGKAVIFVSAITVPLNWVIKTYILIAVNCSILGASLFMDERCYTFTESIVFGISSGFGFAIAITTMAAIRFKLGYSNIPDGLKGLGITMILTGLISMAYLSFSGINL